MGLSSPGELVRPWTAQVCGHVQHAGLILTVERVLCPECQTQLFSQSRAWGAEGPTAQSQPAALPSSPITRSYLTFDS